MPLHSQGGTIAPLTVSRSKDVAFVIAASGVGVPIYEQDLYRVRNGVRGAGFTEEETARAMRFYRLWLEVVRTGEGWERVEAAIPEVRDEKWYKLVAPPARDAWVWSWYKRIGDYDSGPYWEKVHVPVLLVYGERDQTVPVMR
jgi:pimeloyl-ACP methyl ester carboxylesterase